MVPAFVSEDQIRNVNSNEQLMVIFGLSCRRCDISLVIRHIVRASRLIEVTAEKRFNHMTATIGIDPNAFG